MSTTRIASLTQEADDEVKSIPELRACEKLTQTTLSLFQQGRDYATSGAQAIFSASSQALSSFAKWAIQKTDYLHGVSHADLPHLTGGILGQYTAFRDPKGEEWQRVIDRATALAEKHPSKMCYFWIGPHRALVVASKERAAEILFTFKSSMHGGDSLGIFSDLFGPKTIFNLKASDKDYIDQRHTYQRRLLQPKALQKLTPVIQAIVQEHVGSEAKTIADVGEFSVSLAMDVIAKTQLGFKNFTLEDRVTLSGFINAVIPKLVASKVKLPFEKDEVQPLVAQGRAFIKEIIRKNVDTILAADSDSVLKEYILGGGKMQGLKESKADYVVMSSEEMREQLLNNIDVLNLAATFLVVGHETTSNLLRSSLCLLAHPDNQIYQDKLRGYVQAQAENNVVATEVKSVCYTDKILLEALRLHTVIPTFKEAAEADCKLAGGYTLPKNTMIYIPMSYIHRNMLDGDKFDPERDLSFTNKNSGFLPFGIAPRMCPGREFSLLEARTLLEYLVTNFEFECDQDATIKTTKMLNIRYDDRTEIRLKKINREHVLQTEVGVTALPDDSQLRLRF
jgi:cytochrome P450